MISLLSKIRNRNNSIIILKDCAGVILGGYNYTGWKITNTRKGFYGTGESYLFHFKQDPDKVNLYS